MHIHYTLLLFCLLVIGRLSGQQIDRTFQPDLLRPGIVRKTIPLANGDLLIAGDITNVNGTTIRGGLTRLTGGGARVPGFSVDEQVTIREIRAMQAQQDKIILYGFFELADGSEKNLIRLHADGSLDATFKGIDSEGAVADGLAVLPSGKFFVASILPSSYDYQIQLFLEDGSRDPNFTPVVLSDDDSDYHFLYITKLLPLGESSVLVVGQSMRYQGRTQNVYRINTAGKVDKDFNLEVDDDSVFLFTDATVSDDGDIAALVGYGDRLLLFDDSGTLLWENQVDNLRLVRFIDETKVVAIGGKVSIYSTDGWWINGLTLASTYNNFYDMAVVDEGLVIGGVFRSFQGREAFGIVRLNSSSARIVEDTSFVTQLYRPGRVNATFPQPDGRLIVAGDFIKVGQQRTHHLARLEWDGSLDPTFELSTRPVNQSYWHGVQLSDGRMMLSGSTGSDVGDIELIDPDGVVLNATIPFDEFATRSSSENIDHLVKDGLDRVYAGTDTYERSWSKSGQRIKRYAVDDYGGVAETVDYSARAIDSFGIYYGMLADSEDGLYLYGELMRAGGSPPRQIVKLDSEGKFDPTFDPDLPDSMAVRQLIRLPSGGMIVAAFNSYEFAGRHSPGVYLFKLRQDGSRLQDFGSEFIAERYSSYSAPLHYTFDGRLILQSNATEFRGRPISRTAYIDTTFGDPVGPVFEGHSSYIADVSPTSDTTAVYFTGSFDFLPGQQKIVRVLRSTTAVKNKRIVATTRLTLAPNPSSGQPLAIALHPRPAAPTLSYWVYELTSGRLLQRGSMHNTDDIILPVADGTPSGSYILRVDDGHRSWIDKFIWKKP